MLIPNPAIIQAIHQKIQRIAEEALREPKPRDLYGAVMRILLSLCADLTELFDSPLAHVCVTPSTFQVGHEGSNAIEVDIVWDNQPASTKILAVKVPSDVFPLVLRVAYPARGRTSYTCDTLSVLVHHIHTWLTDPNTTTLFNLIYRNVVAITQHQAKIPYPFQIPIGDHPTVWFNAVADKGIESVREAFFTAKLKLPVDTHPDSIGYMSSRLHPRERQALVDNGFTESLGLPTVERHGDSPRITVEFLANVVIWFLNQGDPDLHARLVKNSTPSLFLEDADHRGRKISRIGRGLFL